MADCFNGEGETNMARAKQRRYMLKFELEARARNLSTESLTRSELQKGSVGMKLGDKVRVKLLADMES